jgi:hypothetical protein
MKKKIAFISQPEYFSFTYENDLNTSFEVKEFNFSDVVTNKQWKKLISYQADYNVFFHGETVPNELLNKLEGKRINLSTEPFPREINQHVVYTRDSLNRYRSFRRIREKLFDYVFHYDKSSLSVMEKDGLNISGEFVLPVATGAYQPMAMKKKWDLFFIGRSTNHREGYFGFLKYYYKFLHIAHGVWGPSLVNYICASRICLNVHAADEISWEPRLQMLLACGAFVISEPVTPNNYLRPGIDYVEVSSEAELIESVRYYLEHEEERRQISKNGFERVRDLLSSLQQFSELIDGIDNKKYPKFEASSGSIFWNMYNGLWEFWHTLKNDRIYP